MVISDNESNTSESTVPYMLSENESNEVDAEPVTENIEVTHKAKLTALLQNQKDLETITSN